jgi:transcriptional regulator with XRE-family HTH domain
MTRKYKKRLPEGPFYRDLGRNVRTARSAAGKSQSEVAEFLDVTFQQVQKYENGKNRIPIDRLVSLAGFLEVPLLAVHRPVRERFRSSSRWRAIQRQRVPYAHGNVGDTQGPPDARRAAQSRQAHGRPQMLM